MRHKPKNQLPKRLQGTTYESFLEHCSLVFLGVGDTSGLEGNGGDFHFLKGASKNLSLYSL